MDMYFRILNKVGNPRDKNITCILSTKVGFICSYGGDTVLCLHWKVDMKDFNIVASIHNPKHVECDIDDSKIVQLALNSSEDTLAAATDDGQILTFSFTLPGLLESIGYEANFVAILDQQHKTPIISADTALNRTLHVTCSASTLALWDFHKRKLHQWKRFEDEIRSVAIHPLGINLLVGFRECTKVFNVVFNKIEDIHQIDSKCNSQTSYSSGGHFIAITNESCIEVYSSLSFKKYAIFEGHEGKVTCMLWKNCDHRLLSLDDSGNIQEWDVAQRTKVWSYSSKIFSTLATFSDCIYAATTGDKIWVFENYEKTKEINTQGHVTSLLATNCMLFSGNENGTVAGYNLTMNGDVVFETCCHQGCIINMNIISELEEELRNQMAEAGAKRSKQLQSHEVVIKGLETHYEDIENQLKQKIIDLSEEKYNLQIDIEKNHFEQIKELSEERDENYADFQMKLKKEEEHFKALEEDRVKKIESYEWQLYNLKEEIKASNEALRQIRGENEARLEELEKLLKQLSYKTECSRSLDAEFGKKKQMYDGLKKISNHIKNRIDYMNKEIQRKESVLEDKVAMIKVLQGEAKETEHLTSEANWKLEECKELLRKRSEELNALLDERNQLENEQRHLTRKLKFQQREQLLLEERLKSTEKGIGDCTQKLIKAQLLLERYKKEFIDSTKYADNSTALRWTLLRLLDKRVLRGRIKEEKVFVGDTDPFLKFCRQRDHYESLINIVLNRKQEIEASFRSAYVNLAKENSDWTAFLESLRSDVNLKQERINILETIVQLPAKDFGKDPAGAQKRINEAYEKFKIINDQENEEIQKRMDLIEMQTKELQRLHGLLVVEERGKIARKVAP